jgi:hypothetical protein
MAVATVSDYQLKPAAIAGTGLAPKQPISQSALSIAGGEVLTVLGTAHGSPTTPWGVAVRGSPWKGYGPSTGA